MSCAPDNDQESFKFAGPQSLGTVLLPRRRTGVASC